MISAGLRAAGVDTIVGVLRKVGDGSEADTVHGEDWR